MKKYPPGLFDRIRSILSCRAETSGLVISLLGPLMAFAESTATVDRAPASPFEAQAGLASGISTEGENGPFLEITSVPGALARLGNPLRAIERSFTAHAHSHNDYERAFPLYDALSRRFHSIEADIWLSGGNILVSHHGFNFRGSLQELYLDPLQKLVDTRASVYGDGETVYLWIDIKDGNPQLLVFLQRLLARYPMLSVYSDTPGGTKPGPVTIVLTGNTQLKNQYVRAFDTRFGVRDDHSFSEDDEPADNRWQWYGLKWSRYFEWSGSGPMPHSEQSRLRKLVQSVHAKGKKVRFWGAPDSPGFWRVALSAGIDLVGTDNIHGFSQFLKDAR